MWMKSDAENDDHHQMVKVDSASFKGSQMPITSATTASIFTRHQARNEGKLQNTRWSPTAEQLMALEELYRHGTRTPTALQIQEITAKLRRFGKIEGKNVFYWFQNHKARDKKKQRLKMEAALRSSNFKVSRTNLHNHHSSKTNHSEVLGSEGARVTSLEVDQTKHDPLSICSTSSEESASGPIIAKTPTKTASTNQTKEAIMQCHYSSWKPMEMSFCFPIMNILKNNPLVVPISTNYEINEGSSVRTLELFPLQSGNVKRGGDQDAKSLTFAAGNCGSKVDLSLSLLVSMEN